MRKGSLRNRVVLYVLINSFESFFQTNPSWLIRSSSRKNPAKPKTSASPSVLVTEKSSRRGPFVRPARAGGCCAGLENERTFHIRARQQGNLQFDDLLLEQAQAVILVD